MPYVEDGRTLIQHAFEQGYTLPAFNICSVEMLRACIEAADRHVLDHASAQRAARGADGLVSHGSAPVLSSWSRNQNLNTGQTQPVTPQTSTYPASNYRESGLVLWFESGSFAAG